MNDAGLPEWPADLELGVADLYECNVIRYIKSWCVKGHGLNMTRDFSRYVVSWRGL